MIQQLDHVALLPLYAAAGTAVLVLVTDLVLGRRTPVLVAALVGAAVTGVAAAAVAGATVRATFCNGMPASGARQVPPDCSWVADPLAAVTAVLFAALTIGVLALSVPNLRAGVAPAGEFCFLLACSMTGGVVVGYAVPLTIGVSLKASMPTETFGVDGISAGSQNG